MSSFQGTVTPPPLPASPGMVALANLFDRVCVVCYKATCTGQLDAWPSSMHSKFVLLDSYDVNQQLGIAEVDDHAYLVTQGHGAAWMLLNDPDVNSVLIMEDDWTPNNGTVAAFEDADTLSSMKSFVDGDSWQMIRFGYNPIDFEMPGPCPKQCACSPAPETNLVCSVELANLTTPHCDVRCGRLVPNERPRGGDCGAAASTMKDVFSGRTT